MRDVVIVSACRTAIGDFLGALSSVSATELGAIVIKEAIRRAGIRDDDVDEVIMGNVISAGLGQNPARQAMIHGGIPVSVPAFTVNKVCGSSLKAAMIGADSIKAGSYDTILAGGMESMSNAPYLSPKARWGHRLEKAR